MKLFFARAMVAAGLALAMVAPSVAEEAARVVHQGSVQTSVPAGVTVIVKKITVGEDATVVSLVASFDSRQTNRVNLNDVNAFLEIGNNQKLSLRQPEDNPYLMIQNGQSMDGELVFPGRIPADAGEVRLVFDDGNAGDDLNAPGLQHDRSGAIFCCRQFHCAFDLSFFKVFTGHNELHVNFGEWRRNAFRTLGFQLHPAIRDGLPRLA